MTSSNFNFIGEEYAIPIAPLHDELKLYGSTITTVSTSSTISSSESDALLERFFRDQECAESLPSMQRGLFSYGFRLLGFSSNPLDLSTECSNSRNSAAADMRLAMLSNFSTAYNIVSISLALHILEHVYPYTTVKDQSLCSSALIAGMIVGQLVGGTLGDILGRHRAMTVVMLVQVTAAFGSALSCDVGVGQSQYPLFSLYNVLAATRFILGVGCGGVYPLAATMTAESSCGAEERAKLVALTFSMQGVGYLTVPLIAWLLVILLGESSDYAWRLLLGLGCVPGLVLTFNRVRHQKAHLRLPPRERVETKFSQQPKDVGADDRAAPISILDAILIEKDLVKKLLGTGGCWFLFDILFYGNTLFQPVVLSSAFGDVETIQKAARDTSIIAAIALPGYFVFVASVGRQSPYYIQMQGFLMMGILFAFIGAFFDSLQGNKELLLTLYGLSFFFSNYGPNATTYMLPSMTFSKACRSTLNGVCAACGKAGALVGTLVFVAAAHQLGNNVLMLSCAIISLVGLILTWLCVPDTVGQSFAPEARESGLQGLSRKERNVIEQKLSKVPMRVVVSRPSLLDYVEDI